MKFLKLKRPGSPTQPRHSSWRPSSSPRSGGVGGRVAAAAAAAPLAPHPAAVSSSPSTLAMLPIQSVPIPNCLPRCPSVNNSGCCLDCGRDTITSTITGDDYVIDVDETIIAPASVPPPSSPHRRTSPLHHHNKTTLRVSPRRKRARVMSSIVDDDDSFDPRIGQMLVIDRIHSMSAVSMVNLEHRVPVRLRALLFQPNASAAPLPLVDPAKNKRSSDPEVGAIKVPPAPPSTQRPVKLRTWVQWCCLGTCLALVAVIIYVGIWASSDRRGDRNIAGLESGAATTPAPTPFVLGRTKSPTPAPTTAAPSTAPTPVPMIAFTSLSELHEGVDIYLNATSQPDLAARVRQLYGETINDWNVSALSSLANVFDVYRNPLAAVFDENISAWDVANVVQMPFIFRGAARFQHDLHNWDVSNVRNMESAFQDATAFNGDVSSWNVSNVRNMRGLFRNAPAFQGNLATWDTSNVMDMSYLFYNAANFVADLSSWQTANVTDMSFMFAGATKFFSNLGNWQVGQVTLMRSMFFNAVSYNDDLSAWPTTRVTDMSNMLAGATLFAGPIFAHTNAVTTMRSILAGATAYTGLDGNMQRWDVSNVVDFRGAFEDATSFVGNGTLLSTWNTSRAVRMDGMFANAVQFVGDGLTNWNVQNVTSLANMFRGATMFQANLSSWDVRAVTDASNMLRDAVSFDVDLCAWRQQLPPHADVTNMFVNTACPDPADPDVDNGNVRSGPYCHVCWDAVT